jgi:hypothetical protein
VRVGGHIELSNNPISDKFRNENDVMYEVDACTKQGIKTVAL